MRARSETLTPYELGESSAPALTRIWQAADRATDRSVPLLAIAGDLSDADPAVQVPGRGSVA